MDTPTDKRDISSYDTSWEKWRTEQVQTITQILSNVFKMEEEAQQIRTPSRLLKKSSIASSKPEEEIREKLTQIRQQISEYKQMLKLGLERVDNALEKIDPPAVQPEQKKSFLKRLKSFLRVIPNH